MSPIALRLYYLVTFGAFGLYLPYFPSWLEARGFVGPTMSAIAVLLPTMSIVFPLVFGMLSDALGMRGGLLRLSCYGAAVGFGTMTWAGAALVPVPFWVVFGAMLVFATFRPAMSVLADVIALERSKNYGRVRLWGSLGFLCTSWLGGHLVDPRHPLALPAAIFSFLLLSTLVVQLLPRTAALPPRPAPEQVRRLLSRPPYRWFLLGTFLVFCAHSAYDLCLTLHLRDLHATGGFIGACWALGTTAEVLLLAFIAPSLTRFGPARLLVLAYVAGAARWMLLATVESQPVLIALQPLHALSFALMWVASAALNKEQAGDGGLGTAQGLFAAAMASGATAGIAVWGPLYASAGGEAVFLTASILAATASAAGLFLIRSQRIERIPASQ